MALTKITSAIIADGAITASAITNTSITADKLHTTLDLTGKAVTVATATAGDNDTTAASTAFVSTAIANLADSAPSTLNTLNELAAALGDDANFSTTVTNSIATKLPLAGGTMTGNLTVNAIVDADNFKINGGQGTDGQVLTSTGSGIAWEDAAGGVDGIVSSADATAITIDSGENVEFANNIRFTNDKFIYSYNGGTSGQVRSGVKFDGTNQSLDFYTAQNERAMIDASGNVGIGTTSPNQDGFGSTSRVLTVKAPTSGGTGALELIGLANGSGDIMSAINFMSYAVTNPAARITALRHTADDEASIAFDTSGAERMRISQTGLVGIGTTSPSTELHVYSADQNALTVQTNTGINQIQLANSTNSPCYLTQDSYGFQIKADENGWGGTASLFSVKVKATERLKIAHDGETTITGTKMNVISSAEAVMGAQATGHSYWRVVADNSPNTYFQAGTGQASSQVKMYFTGMYGSNNTMTVDTPNSRVGIGTTSPGKKLDVRGTIRATAANNDISLSDELPGYGANSYGCLKASANYIYLAIGTTYIGYISGSAQLHASDSRLKENVSTLTGALDKVNQLRGVSFNWIDSARGEGTHIGFIAQELEEVYPELVGDAGLPNDDDDQSAIKSVDYGHMVPVLVEAIKELKAENDALKARLDAGGL